MLYCTREVIQRDARMNIRIQFKSNTPIYMQIKEQVIFAIARGEFKKDEPILSVRELALSLKINPNTVVSAYRELEYSKVIYSKRGVGYFVNPDFKKNVQDILKKIVSGKFDILLKEVSACNLDKTEIKEIFFKELEKHNL